MTLRRFTISLETRDIDNGVISAHAEPRGRYHIFAECGDTPEDVKKSFRAAMREYIEILITNDT
jgi:hypothetical protein